MHWAKSLLLQLLQLSIHVIDLADCLINAVCQLSSLGNVDAAESDQMLQILVTLSDRLDAMRQHLYFGAIHALCLR